MDPIELFKLRAAVGRYGEMDAAGWWNTQGVLGSRGAAVYKRGLPRTHSFARVRLLTAVARTRSKVMYPSPGAATLWDLPPEMERELSFAERSWAQASGDEPAWDWSEFMDAIAEPPSDPIDHWLAGLGLITESVAAQARGLELEAGGGGVRVAPDVSAYAIALLAVAHLHGSPKKLVVPFVPGVLGAVA